MFYYTHLLPISLISPKFIGGECAPLTPLGDAFVLLQKIFFRKFFMFLINKKETMKNIFHLRKAQENLRIMHIY